MSAEAPADRPLRGQRIALTGRFARVTRAQAGALIRASGAELVPGVSPLTSVLVVGQRGWPLGKSGRPTAKLQRARQLLASRSLTIWTEAQLLDRLAYSAPHTASASLSSRQLAEILDVPGSRVRAWVRSGLLQPVESLEGASGFDFGQVCWAKSLRDFGGAGISCRRIRRSLDQLKSWLPNLESALGPSAVLERDGHLLVRLEDGQLADATGQGLFDFVAKPSSASLSVQGRQRSAAEWFQEGCAKEAAEDWPAAAQAYQQAIGAGGPDATTSFNLGNVLYRMEAPEAAVQRFQEAIGLDPALVEAWNNLGNVLAELGRPEEAVAALQRALMLRPDFVDARYNLADVLDQLGRYPEAMAYWKQYVAQDPTSPWGRHARKRLAALKS